MLGSELISDTRDLLLDTVKPYLWSDAIILKFLNEAETQFCVRTHALLQFDVSLSISLGSAVYSLPANVLQVVGAKVSTATAPLKPVTAESIEFIFGTTQDEPRAYSTDAGYQYITFYPAPDADYDVTLVCAITPENAIEENTEASIPLEFQHLLCDFSAYKCFTMPDADGGNPETARECNQRWFEGVRDAKRQIFQHRGPRRVMMKSWTGGK